MFNYEDILAMMRSGQTADSIAKEFTDLLNKAVAEDTQQKKEIQKKKDASIVYDTICDFLIRYYPEVEDMLPAEKDIDGFIAGVESLMPVLTGYKTMIDGIAEAWNPKTSSEASFTKPVNVKIESLTGVQAIDEFLKSMGLA